MKRKKPDSRLIQLRAAIAVTSIGCALLIAGFIVAPAGQIHNSVLVAFGECLTFAGSLMGIDYKYRSQND